MKAPKDELPLILPEIVQSDSLEVSILDKALGFRTVHHFPEFPDGSQGYLFAQGSFKTSPPPDSLHGYWFKKER